MAGMVVTALLATPHWSVPRVSGQVVKPAVVGACTPTFSATSVAAGDEPGDVAVGDFDGSNGLDLATANFDSLSGTGDVSILLSDGSGGYALTSTLHVPGPPLALSTGIAVGNFNGTGGLDLAVANFNVDTVSIFAGNGSGGFAALTQIPVGVNPFRIAAGAFDGDSVDDLAVTNFTSNSVSIIQGSTLTVVATVPVGSTPAEVAVGTSTAPVASIWRCRIGTRITSRSCWATGLAAS
jgi:YVTN family beta-propeller protein